MYSGLLAAYPTVPAAATGAYGRLKFQFGFLPALWGEVNADFSEGTFCDVLIPIGLHLPKSLG